VVPLSLGIPVDSVGAQPAATALRANSRAVNAPSCPVALVRWP